MSLKESEIQEVLSTFPELNMIKTEKGIRFVGDLKVNIIYNDVHIVDRYGVSIFIPSEYPLELPNVKETKNRIKTSYSHINKDRTLCLATTTEIKLDFKKEFSIVRWIKKYVIPYLFSHAYYEKYGIFPFGERAHGISGIVEFYKDYFHLDKRIQCIAMLEYICNKRYRGHNFCPCGSGKRVRNCHKDTIIRCQNQRIKDILKEDLKFL